MLTVAEVLGLPQNVSSLDDLDSAVSRGLPKTAVTKVIAALTEDAREATAIRDRLIPSATWKRTKSRLSVHASERAERLARVWVAARNAWNNDTELARAWLRQPHAALQGRAPLVVAATELGARAVEAVLDEMFYGLPA